MNGYRREYDKLHFSQEEKQEMTRRLLAAYEEKNQARRPVRLPRRGALIAAAVLALLTVTAGATGALGSAGEALAGFFGSAPAQTEIIDRIGYPIGTSDTDDGVTITAQAILADRYSYAVVYDIQREDGAPLTDRLADWEGDLSVLPFHFRRGDLGVSLPGQWGGAHGSSHFYDADPSDPAVQYVETMTLDRPIQPGTAKVTFRELIWFDDQTGEEIPVAEGKWTIRFDFAYEDLSLDLPAGQSFRLNGMDATLDAVTLSPLSLQVAYTVAEEMPETPAESGREPEEMRQAHQRFFGDLTVLVTLTDGTVLDLSDAGGSIQPAEGKTVCQKGSLFEKIQPLEEIVSVTVGDMVFPVTE